MSLIYFASTVLSKRFDFGRGSGVLMIINQPPFSQPFSIKTVIQTYFPNIHRVLCQMLLCPITSAGVERANSSLRYIKNVYCSIMAEDRLNALILLFIHRDIKLDYDAIVDMYGNRHPHRMLFVNPLS